MHGRVRFGFPLFRLRSKSLGIAVKAVQLCDHGCSANGCLRIVAELFATHAVGVNLSATPVCNVIFWR